MIGKRLFPPIVLSPRLSHAPVKGPRVVLKRRVPHLRRFCRYSTSASDFAVLLIRLHGSRSIRPKSVAVCSFACKHAERPVTGHKRIHMAAFRWGPIVCSLAVVREKSKEPAVVDRNLREPVVIDTKAQPVSLPWGSLVHGSQSGELNIGAAVRRCTAARNRSVENPALLATARHRYVDIRSSSTKLRRSSGTSKKATAPSYAHDAERRRCRSGDWVS